MTGDLVRTAVVEVIRAAAEKLRLEGARLEAFAKRAEIETAIHEVLEEPSPASQQS